MSSLKINTDLLKDIPLFRALNNRQLADILNASDNGVENYAAQEFIVREDQIADCMYVLLDGYLKITVRGVPPVREITIATLKPGDFFGEQALLPGSSGYRNANVKAVQDSKVFRIDKKYVSLAADADGSHEEINIEVPTATSVPGFEPDEVRDMIANIKLFKNLNNQELKRVREWTEVVTFNAGDIIIKRFQKSGHLYIILEGKAQVFNINQEKKIIVLANLGKGKVFGEQALLPNSTGRSNAYVRATEQSRMIKVEKRHFRAIYSRNLKINTRIEKMKKKLDEEKKLSL